MSTLTIVNSEETKPKRKRERHALIETLPKADWFVCTQEQGRTVWYLRVSITGMLPRRFGPFKNRHRAMLALDGMLDAMIDVITELPDRARKYIIPSRFCPDRWGPVIEDDLALGSASQNLDRT